MLVSSQGHNKLSDDLIELPFGWHHLPFYAIPDGAHTSEESWSGFHLPSLSSQSVGESGPTVFGVSCCRQIDSQVNIKSIFHSLSKYLSIHSFIHLCMRVCHYRSIMHDRR